MTLECKTSKEKKPLKTRGYCTAQAKIDGKLTLSYLYISAMKSIQIFILII